MPRLPHPRGSVPRKDAGWGKSPALISLPLKCSLRLESTWSRAGTTRSLTLLNLLARLAHLGKAAQTFTGATTFSNAAVTIGGAAEPTTVINLGFSRTS